MRLKSFTILVLSLLVSASFYVLYQHSIFRSQKIDRSIEKQLAKHDDLQITIEQNERLLDRDFDADSIPVEPAPVEYDGDYTDTFTQELPIQSMDDQAQDDLLDAPDEQSGKPTPHLFQELSRQNYSTPEERLQFFEELGLNYLNRTDFEYAPALGFDSKVCEKYVADVDGNELLTNRYGAEIALQKLIPLSIRWLGPEIGHGIFAEDDAAEGEFIGIYGGVVKDRSLVTNRDFAWAYPGQTLEGGKITLDAATAGNELRFINDGKDPNCIVQYVVGFDGLWHVCYIAAKDIKKDDQLLVSYGPAYWDTRAYKYQELASFEPVESSID